MSAATQLDEIASQLRRLATDLGMPSDLVALAVKVDDAARAYAAEEVTEADLDFARAVNAATFAPPVPSCWCGMGADVLVTVDPYCSTPTHTITVGGFEGEPAIAVCDQHAASMSGAVCQLDGGVSGWAR